MNEKAEFAVRVLKQYALENQIPARSTSDLSPMDQWLILRLLAVIKNEVSVCENCKVPSTGLDVGVGKCLNCNKEL